MAQVGFLPTALPSTVTGIGPGNPLFNRVTGGYGTLGSPTGIKTSISQGDLLSLGWQVGPPTDAELHELIIPGDNSVDFSLPPALSNALVNSSNANAIGANQVSAEAPGGSGISFGWIVVIVILFLLLV